MPFDIIEKEQLWEKALAEIELSVSRPNFLTWFQNTSIVELNDDIITLNVPNNFVKEWLFNKYHKTIIKALRALSPAIRNVEYIISSQPLNNAKITPHYKPLTKTASEKPQLEFEEIYIDKKANLNPRYTFDNFIVGSFNELARAAAFAIIKNLGSTYNPLFIYGGTGLGKTHLLQAIGNQIRQENPAAQIHYLTSEKFANEYITAIQNGTVASFKEKYRQHDLLIIDDVQFFSGKPKIQEEFFHLFNALYEANKQLVFSSDRSPKVIPELEDRLRSRFEGGMMADIAPPEYEARVAILKVKAGQKEVDLSEEIIEFIAKNIQSNIRELEGALQSVIAQSKLLNKVLTLQEAKEALQKNIKTRKKTTIVNLIKIVTEFYSISEKDIFEKTRKKQIVLPRQIAMYLLREDFNSSYPYIGEKFGGKDHTTVIHAYEKISANIKTNDKLREDIRQIRELLYEKEV
ncbi:MAG: chromosomal replication initiator protein DnaA [bacterium]|nr:chromosomal replication initiator protein DnaA [bacterium]